MKILVVGAGNMGAFFVESMCLDYEVGVYDRDKTKLKYFFNSHKFISLEEIKNFAPDLMINAVSLQHTREAFDETIPLLPESCIISDITSVKNGLKKYYEKSGRRFVSTHPMFGPTFANVKDLRQENAILIKESDPEGKEFFRNFYATLHLKIHEYSFEAHDQTIAYSLSIPFSSTMVFAACMKTLEAPGTTFKKHLSTAKGLLSEDDYLLSEILLNPYTLEQVEKISDKLNYLIELIRGKKVNEMHAFFNSLRMNIDME